MAMGNTYYFSDVSGDDSRTPTQARNQSTPWKSITKLNAYFSSLSNGDSILFKRGETFYGSITFNHSSLVMDAYGIGAKPIISGFYLVPSFTNMGANIWESTTAVSTLSTCNIISIAGTNYAQGRTPDAGYWEILSTGGNNIVDATHLNASTNNWQGAQVVLRKYRWIMDKFTIASASGSTINFTNSGDAIQAGWGYFIQNDVRCLNLANEWYYSSGTKKLSIYSTTAPTNVKIPALDQAIDINGENNITIRNLQIQGFNSIGINTTSQSGINIINCDFSFIGVRGIYGYPNSNDLTVTGCTLTDMGSQGIHAGSSSNAYIANNSLMRTGHFPGMGSNGDDSYTGIISNGDDGQVLNNSIQYTGYCGIRWDGNSSVIKNNFVNMHNYVKDDGGGIYCYPNQLGPVNQAFTTRTIEGNIVINGIGAVAGGEPSSNDSEGYSIYTDGTSPDINIINNTMANAQLGLFMNGSHQMLVRGNTIYNHKRGLYLINYNPSIGIADITVRANKFIAKEATQYAAYYEPAASTMPASFDADSNIYARPVDDDDCIWYDASGVNNYVTLAQWKASAFASGEDAASTKSPIAISAPTALRFDYNADSTTANVNLRGQYLDFNGTPISGTITLEAHTGSVLMKTGNEESILILRNTIFKNQE